MKEINWVTLSVALLGAAKIVLEVFGVEVITDDLIDSTANAVAAVVAVLGVIMSHSKPKQPAVVADSTPYDFENML